MKKRRQPERSTVAGKADISQTYPHCLSLTHCGSLWAPRLVRHGMKTAEEYRKRCDGTGDRGT